MYFSILFSEFSVLSYFTGKVHNLWQNLRKKNSKQQEIKENNQLADVSDREFIKPEP